MRNLLLSLMVLTALVSCGKDNSVGSPAAPVVSNPITNTDANATQLATLIDTSESTFGTGYISGMTWNQAIASYPTLKYKYASTSASSNQNCEEKTGWFGIKYTVCSSSSNSVNATYTYVTVNTVDLTTKRNEIKAIINSAVVNGIQYSGSYFQIRTISGVVYVIDRTVPLQANPVAVYQTNGQSTQFVQGLYQ